MKIRTVNQLIDELDGDYSWRLKELADVKILVRANSFPIKASLLRAGVALAYAHWEGFVKSSVDYYLDFVKSQKVPIRELAPCLVALSKRGLFHQFGESKKFAVYSRLVVELMDEPFINQRAVFGSPIRTGNLRSHVFVDISESIGVPTSKYETRFNFIDVSLVDRRNDIAHGQHLLVDHESFPDLIDDVINLIREFKTDLEALATGGHFRRPAPPAIVGV